MQFSQRFQKALAFKSLDVEEPIDVRLHRPLAAVLTALVSVLPVTPNQVTLMSLALGWAGAFFLYQAFFNPELFGPLSWLMASVLLFGSVIFDCADGQLARSKGGGSRVGRILDGFVDALVLFPTYVILGFGIREMYGTLWFVVAAVGGFSTWIHCIVYDKLKNLYLAHTMPQAGGGEGTETLDEVRQDFAEARRSGSPLEIALLWIYIGYLQVQERFASGSTEKRDTLRDDARMEAFRVKNRLTMRMASWLGLGTHMFLIYLAIGLAAVLPEGLLALQLVFGVLFNAWMALVLVRSRAFNA